MLKILSEAEVLDAGVDWMTVTSSAQEAGEALMMIGERECSNALDDGSLPKKAAFQGYKGYAIGSLFYGTRTDGVCLRASGNHAHALALEVARYRPHVTRLDLQVTAKMKEDNHALARTFIDTYRANAGRTHGNTKRNSKLVDSGSSGSTAVLGERTAPWYGRFYDKHRESKGAYPVGTWRVESECKRTLAQPTWEILVDYEFDKRACASLVRAQWARAGVNVAIPDQWPMQAPIVPRVPSDVERKLLWLRTVASKVYKELYEAGYQEEASSAMFAWLVQEDHDQGEG